MLKQLVLGLGLLFPASAMAGAPIHQAGNFGLGLGGGVWNTGISMKYYLSETHAIQGVVGTFRGGNGIGLNADYLLEMPPALLEDEVLNINWNVGPGAMLFLDDDYIGIGATGALGLEFNFNPPVPLDIVLEYRPALLIVPDVYFDPIGFTGHIRLYF